MGQLLTGYTMYFNRRHRRVGHLTQGRYKAQVVEGNSYLLKLSRYIHLNPVCVRSLQGFSLPEKRKALRAYRWSTYRSYAGLEKPWPWIEYEAVRALLMTKGRNATVAYRRYVESGLAETDEEFQSVYAEARLAVGTESFRQEIECLHTSAGEAKKRREDVSFRRTLDWIPPGTVLRLVAEVFGVTVEELRRPRRNAADRAAACWFLQRESGLTQRGVAEQMGLGSGRAVGYQIRAWERQRQKPEYKDKNPNTPASPSG